MTRFHAKLLILPVFLAIVLALSAQAQPAGDGGSSSGSLPPPAFDGIAPESSGPVALTPSAPVVPPVPAPVLPSPFPAMPSVSVEQPVALPVDLGKPVETTALGDISPETVGLLSVSDGGLGAGMWKGTSHSLIEHLLSALNLPTFSPELNNLARLFLLTTADVSAGKSGNGSNLIALRVNALTALGDVKEAHKLMALAKPEQIDDAILHKVLEAALVNGESADVCAKLPDVIKSRPKTDWQEMLLVCQLSAKDIKAAQLTLDLMHTQGVKNDNLFYIAERDIMGGGTELPRQLSPLKPSILALLQLADLSLHGEIYVHPDAALVPPLLALKTKDDNSRLALAESASERGILTPAQLEAVYASIVFMPDIIANALSSTETDLRLHALLYQAAFQEKAPEKRVALSLKFLQSTTAAGLNGAAAGVLADMIGPLQPSEEYNSVSVSMARIYLMAGNAQAAAVWYKQAQHAATFMSSAEAELQDFWPLAILGGLEADSGYAQNLSKWLDAKLKTPDAKNDNRMQREQAASILLLFDATGFAVPDEDWGRVIGVPSAEKHAAPPALFLERLQAASAGGRRGEAVLFGLLLSGGDVDETSLLSTLAIIKALRLVGLTAHSAALARETMALVLAPPPPAALTKP